MSTDRYFLRPYLVDCREATSKVTDNAAPRSCRHSRNKGGTIKVPLRTLKGSGQRGGHGQYGSRGLGVYDNLLRSIREAKKMTHAGARSTVLKSTHSRCRKDAFRSLTIQKPAASAVSQSLAINPSDGRTKFSLVELPTRRSSTALVFLNFS